MTRRTERVIAAIVIGGAVLFAAVVFVWRVVYDDAPWSLPRILRWPTWDRWGAFAVYAWVQPFVLVASSGMVIIAAIRRRIPPLALPLTAIVSIATALLYLPFWFQSVPTIDRVLRERYVPVHSLRFLVIMVMLTLALNALHVVLSGEIAVAVILNAILLLLVWLPWILPIGNGWSPMEWQRPDLLIAVRPCREALLWQVTSTGKAYELGAIDDIWSNFADPRHGRTPTRAISVRGDWRADYYWLDASDLRALRVRADDPAVVHCDARVRQEPVTPAAWHTVGVDW